MRDDVSPNPIAGIVAYGARNCAFQNCIVIDGDDPTQWMNTPTELSGCYYQPNDSGAVNLTIDSCLAINTAMSAGALRSGSTGQIIHNFVGVHLAGGFDLPCDVSAQNITLVDLGTGNFTYRSADQINALLAANVGIQRWASTQPLLNTIFRDIGGNGSRDNLTCDYIDMFQIAGTNFPVGTQPAHYFTTDPFTNGLLYPVRIEASSSLAAEGSGGGPVGANILQRIGSDGTFNASKSVLRRLSISPPFVMMEPGGSGLKS